MRTARALLCVPFVLSLVACAPEPAAPPPLPPPPPPVVVEKAPEPTPPPPPAEAPIDALPYSPSLDPAAMDPQADACTDFYQYACGGWIKSNPIPADQAAWSVYAKLEMDNQRLLWGILAGLAKPDPSRSAAQQKIGDYFAACMDEAAIEKRGATPIQPWLNAVTKLRSPRDLPLLLAQLHSASFAADGSGILFGFGSQQDYKDASRVVAEVAAGGLGLPDRDDYFRADAESEQIRVKYQAHVKAMFQLLGDTPDAAGREAAAVFDLEKGLAGASFTRVDMRDPRKLDHTLTVAQLQALTPSFDWTAYLGAMGLSGLKKLNVDQPRFVKQVERQLAKGTIDDLRTYLRWQVVRFSAPYLSRALADASFDFYGRTLRGVPNERARWKRCVSWVDNDLGEALGQEFVRRTFAADTKAKALDMTQRIEAAMEADLTTLSWMGPKTRKEALAKLHGMVNKIGYPDAFRDYGPVTVAADDFFGDLTRAHQFEAARWMRKVGQPVDRKEWFMTPPTVNAYYSSQLNDMNFPAGVLQPPLYDPKLDDAPNYGNTGSTIGHELTHGFDDEGRRFDSKGNLRDFWTPADGKAFDSRAQCVVDQYAKYTVVDDVKINSQLTEGEDIADLGGTILAYIAWKTTPGASTATPIGGFTPDQRFFVGLAQWACENQRPENLRLHAHTDPHSPGRYRINGVVANIPEFQRAFSCKASSPMVNPHPCRVW